MEATLSSAEKLKRGHWRLTRFSGLITTGAGVKVETGGTECFPFDNEGGNVVGFLVAVEVALLNSMVEPYTSLMEEPECL